MLEPRTARWPWGLRVAATIDLVNDGSHPQASEGALLAAAGTVGEIVQVGHHAEANLPVYLVDFDGMVVGVFEEEIAPLDAAPPAAADSPATSTP